MAPRSSATTFRPASVSSLARMPPVQPSPTITASTSLSLVAMARPSAHVRDADRIGGKFLVAILLDIVAMHRDRARESDHPPSGLVAVSAIDRIGEHAFPHGLIDRRPEHPRRQAAVEGHLAGRQPDHNVLALRLLEPVEGLAVGLAAMRIGGLDAGAIELGRRQRELVALARCAALPRSLHVKTI